MIIKFVKSEDIVVKDGKLQKVKPSGLIKIDGSGKIIVEESRL